jgi:hypothetical protein
LSLQGAQRRRYARQLLLSEVGERGQERLLAARFRPAAGCDPDAYAVAADYLERAGLSFDPAGTELRVADADAIERLAGSPCLREPAAWIAGAFAAVEHLKEVLGIAAARELPADLCLRQED